jgi:ATP-dependent helicase Lhr and Lhr-like helicase
LLPQDFHPVIRRWWENHFAEALAGASSSLPPTDAQLEGWQAIRRGENTLIAAPTGSGKTSCCAKASTEMRCPTKSG